MWIFTRYEQRVLSKIEGGSAAGMPGLNRPVIETMSLYDDILKNFTVFFALQRYLCKWGGERLTNYSREHMAFDFLFLHLYTHAVPPEYQYSSYQEEWDGIPREDIERAAAYVRNSFRRRGEGPAVMV